MVSIVGIIRYCLWRKYYIPLSPAQLTSKEDGENIADISELLTEKLNERGMSRWTRVLSSGYGGECQSHNSISLEAFDVLLLLAHQTHLYATHRASINRHAVFNYTPGDRAAVVPLFFVWVGEVGERNPVGSELVRKSSISKTSR